MELSTTLIIVGIIILLIVGIVLFVVLTPSPQQGWVTKQTTNLGSSGPPDTGIIVPGVATFSNKSVYTFGADYFEDSAVVTKTYDVFDAAQNSNPRKRLEIVNDADGFTSCLVKYDTDGLMVWTAKITGTWNIGNPAGPEATYGRFVTTDINENIYVIGSFGANLAGETVTFYDAITDSSQNPSARWTMTRLANASNNVFLVKYNKNGIVQWTTKIGSPDNSNNVIGNSIACNDTNVFVTGYFRGNINFYDGLQGNPTTTKWSMTNSAAADGYVVKYDFNGSVIWSTKIGSAGIDVGGGLAVNNTNVYVSGFFVSNNTMNLYNAVQGNPTVIVGTLTKTSPNAAGFLVNFNVNGELQWSTKQDSTVDIAVKNMTLDKYNNIYIVLGNTTDGIFYDAVTGENVDPLSWNPTTEKWTVLTQGDNSGIVAKYNSAGVLQWTAKSDFLTKNCTLNGVTTDSDANVYVLNSFDTTTLYDGAAGNPTVERWTLNNQSGETGTDKLNSSLVKYNSEGKVLWSTLLSSPISNQLFGISADTNDNVYISGNYFESVSVYEVNGLGLPTNVPTVVYPTNGYRQGIIVKYTKDGQIIG